jgi:hypothetical protein
MQRYNNEALAPKGQKFVHLRQPSTSAPRHSRCSAWATREQIQVVSLIPSIHHPIRSHSRRGCKTLASGKTTLTTARHREWARGIWQSLGGRLAYLFDIKLSVVTANHTISLATRPRTPYSNRPAYYLGRGGRDKSYFTTQCSIQH